MKIWLQLWSTSSSMSPSKWKPAQSTLKRLEKRKFTLICFTMYCLEVTYMLLNVPEEASTSGATHSEGTPWRAEASCRRLAHKSVSCWSKCTLYVHVNGVHYLELIFIVIYYGQLSQCTFTPSKLVNWFCSPISCIQYSINYTSNFILYDLITWM